MHITGSIDTLRALINKQRSKETKVGFVPTMGALHDGHISLIKQSVSECQITVVSIFVNPIQFNTKEDFETYPETLKQDLTLAKINGADFVFTPSHDDLYINHKTYVDVEDLTNHLCGSKRPGHFRGVFTIVTKLFNIVAPDIAYFGQKDLQQVLSIKKLCFDLNYPIQIVIAPTIREVDGLAMSSRNIHLSDTEHVRALSISQSIVQAAQLITQGERDAVKLCRFIFDYISDVGSPEKIDYVTAIDCETLQPIKTLTQFSAIAIAVFFDSTRLIDNMIIDLNGDLLCKY